jgi:acetyltransferase-like isoleucine patch superfamily enzyme
MPYRQLTPGAAAGKLFEELVEGTRERIRDPRQDRNVVVRDLLLSLFFEQGADYEERLADPKLPPSTRAAIASLDPRNISLEPEYYTDCDPERYARVKPLTWLWIQFDRSPLGMNCHVAFPFRRMLAEHVFKHCGRNVKLFQHVEYTYGYNLVVEDDCTIHRHVFLDDRGEVILRANTSVSDYANIYSHSHDVVDIGNVSLGRTEIGPHARITYHATVLSGIKVGQDGMLGAVGLATRDVPDCTVAVGIPAKAVKKKDPCPVCRR